MKGVHSISNFKDPQPKIRPEKQLGISTTVHFAIVDLYLDVFRCFHFTLDFGFVVAVGVGVVVEADELVELLEDRQKLFASFRRSAFTLLFLDSVLMIENRFCLFGFKFNYFMFLFTDYVPYIFVPPFFVSLSLFCFFLSICLFLFISLSVSFCHSLFLPVSIFLSPCPSLCLCLFLSAILLLNLSIFVFIKTYWINFTRALFCFRRFSARCLSRPDVTVWLLLTSGLEVTSGSGLSSSDVITWYL